MKQGDYSITDIKNFFKIGFRAGDKIETTITHNDGTSYSLKYEILGKWEGKFFRVRLLEHGRRDKHSFEVATFYNVHYESLLSPEQLKHFKHI